MKPYLLLGAMMILGSSVMYAEIEDDIYYNPKKAAHKSNQEVSTKNNRSNYIPDYQDMDPDYYNMRGQYYSTPIDTIGARVENDPDFVYTTQIQKYYNPTIVVDNESLLGDVLNNSYGNVTIEYNIQGVPSFGTWWGSLWSPGWSINIGSPYYYGGYYNYYNPWYWGPSYSWNWGPSWSWGWGSAWYPSWGWGGGYWGGYIRPSYGASYRPGGNRPVGPRPGWSSGSHHNYAGRTPGYNHNNGYNRNPGLNSHTPGYNRNPGHNGTSTVPVTPGHNTGYGRQPGQGAYQSTRPGNSGTSSGHHSTVGTRPATGTSTVGNGGGYRPSTGGSGVSTAPGRQTGSGAYKSNSGTSGSSHRTYNSNSNSIYNSNSNSNRSYNSNSTSNR
ncbi:MAG: hypothetical protein K2K29_01125, partial [Muribaculaceae bacterium]|nr:hypothetical protein [Muribaculaceae bacterium]